jgi:hypothetical protein
MMANDVEHSAYIYWPFVFCLLESISFRTFDEFLNLITCALLLLLLNFVLSFYAALDGLELAM